MVNPMVPSVAALLLSLIALYLAAKRPSYANKIEQLDLEMEDVITAIERQGYAIELINAPYVAPVKKQDSSASFTDHLPLQGHTIIVGQSGSGKSNVIMAQIIRRLNAQQQLHVIDTKGEIAPIFGRHVSCVGTDGAKAKFKELIAQAQLRQDMFAMESAAAEEPIRDYSEYFRVTGHRLPIITLVVEELVVTMDEVEEEQLVKLLVLGRSAGVFVVAASQYLTAQILSRKGSINFGCRVYLGKPDPVSIRTLFGSTKLSTSAEDFLGPAGKAVVEEKGEYKCVTMPEVTSQMLIPYMRKQ